MIRKRLLKIFPLILVLHLILGGFVFMGVFLLIHFMDYETLHQKELKPLVLKSFICSCVNLALPFYFYFKWKRENHSDNRVNQHC